MQKHWLIVLSNYIKFSEDLCLSKRTIARHNNKQWCDKEVLKKLSANDSAYKNKLSDSENYKRAKEDLKNSIRKSEDKYKLN